MKVKIITYNILNGLCSETVPYRVDDKRKEAIAKLLEDEKPNIVVFCEACCWPLVKHDPSMDYRRFLEELANPNPADENSFRWAPAILSNFPISSTNLSKYFRSFVRASIMLEKNNLHLDVVHPHPDLTEEERKQFFLGVIKGRKDPYVVTGDFNSLSPIDTYDLGKLIKGYEGFMGEKGKWKAEDIFQASALKAIMRKGMMDTYSVARRSLGYTVPTDWRNKSKDSAVRLDYIFCSDGLRIVDAGIIKNDLTDMASDHYPVYAVFEI